MSLLTYSTYSLVYLLFCHLWMFSTVKTNKADTPSMKKSIVSHFSWEGGRQYARQDGQRESWKLCKNRLSVASLNTVLEIRKS